MTSCHDDDVCCTKNEQGAPVRRRVIDLRANSEERTTYKKEARELTRALDTKGTPKLNLSFQFMPSTLCNFFTTRKGEQMWPRIYAILKFYCEGPNDFLNVEDFSGIYCYHWGETFVYKTTFGVHQNEFFANLQEYVDTWFDQICAMRMRLRAKPRTQNNMKYPLQTRYDKEKDGKSVFAFPPDCCGQNMVEEAGVIRLPALNPEDFPELDTETMGKLKLARRSLYFMLFFHFGRDGIIFKQYDQATKKFGWGGYDVTNEQTIRKYMADIIEFKEKGFVKRIRPRFDVPKLIIDKPVLTELGLLEEYKQAKGSLLVKTQPVSTSTSTTIAQQPQHSTATVNVRLRGREATRARSVRSRSGGWTNEAIRGMIQSLPAYGSLENVQQITNQEVTQTTINESSSELEVDSAEVEILRNELQKMSPTVRRFVLILAKESECKMLDSQLRIRPEFRDKNDQSELLALALDNRYGDIIGTTMVPVNDIQFELKVKSDKIIQVIQSTNFY